MRRKRVLSVLLILSLTAVVVLTSCAEKNQAEDRKLGSLT